MKQVYGIFCNDDRRDEYLIELYADQKEARKESLRLNDAAVSNLSVRTYHVRTIVVKGGE